jgi:HEAT repeat protein
MGFVFLSYKEEERDFAETLMSRLERDGVQVCDHKNIPYPLDEWYLEIDRAIRQAAVLIVIMTPMASASESVMYEWIYALGAGIPVIPVVVKDTVLHPRLIMLPRFDFTNRTALPWDALIEAVQKAITEAEPHRILIPLGTPSYIREAIKALDSANPDDREGAIDNLAQSDHPVAVHALAGALSHPLPDVRMFAALARGKVGDTRALPELLNALHQEDEEISDGAIIALGNIGDITVAPHLIKTLYRRWDRSRYLIANALKKMGDAAVPFLQKILQEELVERKVWSIQTLREMGGAAVPSLIEALHDKEHAVKVYAIGALSEIGGPAAVSSLIEVLESENEEWSIRDNAAEALGKIGDMAAVPGLIRALSYNDESVRREAARALRQIGSSAVPPLVEALLSAEGELRRRITAQLRSIGTPEALAALNTKSRH